MFTGKENWTRISFDIYHIYWFFTSQQLNNYRPTCWRLNETLKFARELQFVKMSENTSYSNVADSALSHSPDLN